MQKRLVGLFGGLIGALFCFGNGAWAELRPTFADSSGYVFDLVIERPEYRFVQEGGQTYRKIVMPGWAVTTLPGSPQLPMLATLVPCVGAGQPVLEILDDQWEDQPVGRILPAPRWETSAGESGEMSVARYLEDVGAYASASMVPTVPVTVGDAGRVRDTRMARIVVNPLQYNSSEGVLRAHSRIRFRVRFEESAKAADPNALEKAAPRTSGPLAPMVRTPAATAPPASSVKLLVGRDGIHMVTGASLKRAGVPIAKIDVSQYRLLWRGQEIPIFLPNPTPKGRRLAAGDTLVFYGQKNPSEFSRTNVYWLTWGGGAGLRMETLDGTIHPDTIQAAAVLDSQHHEKDYYYWYSMPNGEGENRIDSWFYWKLYTGGPAFPTEAGGDFPMTLDEVSQARPDAWLKIALKDRENPGLHHVAVLLNGETLYDGEMDPAEWPDAQVVLDLPFLQSLLTNGENLLTIRTLNADPVTRSLLYLNWFEMERWRNPLATGGRAAFAYPAEGKTLFRVEGFPTQRPAVVILGFDVSDPLAPRVIRNAQVLGGSGTGSGFLFEDQLDTPRRYEVVSGSAALQPVVVAYGGPRLRRSNAADYIVITPEAFEQAIAPLANFRASRAQGLRVLTARIQAVYDEFNWGLKDPRAIRDFLQYAYETFRPPAPRFVLLVGDANIDYLQNYRPGNPYEAVEDLRTDWIPTWIARSFSLGDTPSDNRYVCVTHDEEGNYDILPDMAIGRIPARTAEQVTAVVNKILSYEQRAKTASWRKDLLFVADQNDPLFEEVNEGLIADFLPPDFTPHRLYLSSYTPEECNNTHCDAGREALQDELAQGRLISSYVGHGNYYNWAGELILTNDDTATLPNWGMPGVFLTFTCLNGDYARWNDESLAEKLLLERGRGAVACFSPTQMGMVEEHEVLARDLFQTLFGERQNALGLAVWEAKLKNPIRENLDFYTLFGDPALRLPLP
jgi:hypothetical protein